MKNILITIFIIFTNIVLCQTEQQIKIAKKYISKTGMSEIEVKKLARSKGFSDQQIDDAIQKEKDSNSYPKKPFLEELDDVKTTSPEKSNQVIQDIIKFDESIVSSDGEKKVKVEEDELFKKTKYSDLDFGYFGYDIFKKDPALFQSTSTGAVDSEYLIGTGDEIIIMLWGETQFRQVLTVDREGFVFIPEIGQVFVNGFNFKLLESKLFRVFSQSYASLSPVGREPTTFLDLSLGNLRPLRIQVLGQVSQPGAYTVSPSATLFSALYYFNGPTVDGSLRDIQLIRNGIKIATIDFYNYLLTGKKPEDQKLQLDDVIFIPRRLKTITIEGEIASPGIYELKQAEELSDLIQIAGGLKVTAYMDRSQIDRIVPFKERKELGMDRMFVDVNLQEVLESKKKFPLQDADQIKIFSVFDNRNNVVKIRGAVNRPGDYDLGDSLKISDLINKADGLNGDAYLERIDIVRKKADFTEQLIELNLSKMLEGDPDHDIYLKSLDRIMIYGLTNQISKDVVLIKGHIKRPGSYPLQENMKISDLIFKAGGFLDPKFKKRAYLDRADLLRVNEDRITQTINTFNLKTILENPESKDNIFLKSSDQIILYGKSIFISVKPVEINGAIRKPGTYNFKLGMNLNDLILEAGGIETDVQSFKVEIARRDSSKDQFINYADVITFNLNNVFKEEDNNSNQAINSEAEVFSKNFSLKPYDMVSIRANPLFKNQKHIILNGEVKYPGKYIILKPDEKITDVLIRAGGLLVSAYPEASRYLRKGVKLNFSLSNILKDPTSKLNFNIQNGDELKLFPYPNAVITSGSINKQGMQKFISGKSLKYYIKTAGGFSLNADEDNVWVEYPNGNSKKYNKWSLIKPKIIDGSIIIVGKLEETEPFDKTEFAKELTSIFANLAQAIAIIVLAKN